MTTIPVLPQNIDPRIAEILRKRRAQGTVIVKTVPVQAQSTGAPPQWPGSVGVQVPMLDTPPVPQTTTVALGDGELAEGLALVLPAADALIRRAILALRNDGRLTMAEALGLAPEIRNIVSEVVAKLLPEIKGTSARELVILVLAQLLQQYLAPYLPAPLRGWLTAQTLRTLVQGLQFAYDTWVRPRLGQKQPIKFMSGTAAY